MVEFPVVKGDRPANGPEECSSDDGVNSSSLLKEDPIAIEPAARRYSVAEAKDSMRETFDNIVQSGAADQMRGYANQAMGKTKMTLGIATQSPNLMLSGLAQIVVGEFQKSVGEAKIAEDSGDIFP
ncbi:MAG: CsbD family protein [Alphaproteobacteria bacterium]|nr:CsbD family protein [Alphaproteobacteria bacterium]MBM3623994.1 CsbD family protein [Alphaproteobacteria bacterium]